MPTSGANFEGGFAPFKISKRPDLGGHPTPGLQPDVDMLPIPVGNVRDVEPWYMMMFVQQSRLSDNFVLEVHSC